jgi:hypothetical protein
MVLLIRGKIIVIFVHRGVDPLLFLEDDLVNHFFEVSPFHGEVPEI